MCRERALKVARVLLKFFCAANYPLLLMVKQEPALAMMSLYLTLGVFQLLPSRNPSAHRSLIALTA